eukprot:UN0518
MHTHGLRQTNRMARSSLHAPLLGCAAGCFYQVNLAERSCGHEVDEHTRGISERRLQSTMPCDVGEQLLGNEGLEPGRAYAGVLDELLEQAASPMQGLVVVKIVQLPDLPDLTLRAVARQLEVLPGVVEPLGLAGNELVGLALGVVEAYHLTVWLAIDAALLELCAQGQHVFPADCIVSAIDAEV